MSPHKNAFIRLALDCHVLQWGNFTLKSGRNSPYFFNAGLFYQNYALSHLGRCYAELILEHNIDVQHLFGPAYKGVPLATATAIALDAHQKSVTVTFNRKEAKQHGEGGVLIGSPLTTGNTVMIDDVITAGTAFRESKKLIQEAGGNLTAVLIALDRCERGSHTQSTLTEIRNQGIAVHAIITLFDLIQYLEDHHEFKLADNMRKYHAEYGASE
jgi:orotate phosphoribosyltransferase